MEPFTKRLERVRKRMEEMELDAFLVSAASNLNYLTGSGLDFNAVGLITDKEAVFATDFRFMEETRDLPVGWEQVVVDESLFLDVPALLRSLLASKSPRVGIEKLRMTVADWTSLSESQECLGTEFIQTRRLIEEERAIKGPEEIALMRKAADALNEVFAWLASEVSLEGRREIDVAWLIEERLRQKHNASTITFEPVVASAERAARPHARAEQEFIPANTLLMLDFGARIDGYAADCARTWAIGKPDGELLEIYQIVKDAQESALSLVEPGRPCIEVHEHTKQFIKQAGYGEFFNHGTGHGVGIESHEEPRFRDGFAGNLAAGNVVTVEPGIYLPGLGGCRIEDEVLVTEDGYELLTHFPKDLFQAA